MVYFVTTVINASAAVTARTETWKKFRLWAGFEPTTSAMPVQCSLFCDCSCNDQNRLRLLRISIVLLGGWEGSGSDGSYRKVSHHWTDTRNKQQKQCRPHPQPQNNNNCCTMTTNGITSLQELLHLWELTVERETEGRESPWRRALMQNNGCSISFPEPTCLLVSTKTRVLVLTKRHVGSGNEIEDCQHESSRDFPADDLPTARKWRMRSRFSVLSANTSQSWTTWNPGACTYQNIADNFGNTGALCC